MEFIVQTVKLLANMLMKVSRWYVVVFLMFHFLTTLQISAMTDMVAVPTAFAQALSTAKGGWGHSAAQAVKGAAYSAVSMASKD